MRLYFQIFHIKTLNEIQLKCIERNQIFLLFIKYYYSISIYVLMWMVFLSFATLLDNNTRQKILKRDVNQETRWKQGLLFTEDVLLLRCPHDRIYNADLVFISINLMKILLGNSMKIVAFAIVITIIWQILYIYFF